jgi:hypothetical protein
MSRRNSQRPVVAAPARQIATPGEPVQPQEAVAPVVEDVVDPQDEGGPGITPANDPEVTGTFSEGLDFAVEDAAVVAVAEPQPVPVVEAPQAAVRDKPVLTDNGWIVPPTYGRSTVR